MSDDFARQAGVMRATAACMEILAPLSEKDRQGVIFSLVVLFELKRKDGPSQLVTDLIERATKDGLKP